MNRRSVPTVTPGGTRNNHALAIADNLGDCGCHDKEIPCRI